MFALTLLVYGLATGAAGLSTGLAYIPGNYAPTEELIALSQTVRNGIAQRSGTVHSYTLFTGYMPRRVRGEMRSFQILGSR